MVEVETAAKDAPLIVGVGKTPFDVLRDTPAKVHGLKPFETKDQGFDAAFNLFSSDPDAATRFLTEDRRAALIALSERHGHEPPHLVIMQGYLAVLFPRLECLEDAWCARWRPSGPANGAWTHGGRSQAFTQNRRQLGHSEVNARAHGPFR